MLSPSCPGPASSCRWWEKSTLAEGSRGPRPGPAHSPPVPPELSAFPGRGGWDGGSPSGLCLTWAFKLYSPQKGPEAWASTSLRVSLGPIVFSSPALPAHPAHCKAQGRPRLQMPPGKRHTEECCPCCACRLLVAGLFGLTLLLDPKSPCQAGTRVRQARHLPQAHN